MQYLNGSIFFPPDSYLYRSNSFDELNDTLLYNYPYYYRYYYYYEMCVHKYMHA